MRSFLGVGFFIVFLATFGGCQRSPDDGKEKIYDIRGKVEAVDPDKGKVTLDHEDIPGFMRAMKMPFSVENAKLLDAIKPGDQVEGKLKVRAGGYVITELKKR